MDVVKQAIKCSECWNFLVKPVMLPCGWSVCQKHLENSQNPKFFCKLCNKEHQIEKSYMNVNKALDSLVKANLENLNLGPEYVAFNRCNQLDQTINEIEMIRDNASCFIDKIVDKLKLKTEIIQTEFKTQIDEKAKQIIQLLDNYKKECKINLNSSDFKAKMNQLSDELISKLKSDLSDWNKTFNNLDVNENELKTIQKTSSESNLKLKNETSHIKKEILVNKLNNYYSYVHNFQQINLTSAIGLDTELKEFYEILIDQETFDSKIIDSSKKQQLLSICTYLNDKKSKLIYRASEHGFSTKDFHTKCDNISNTLTIIKSTSGYIFGGFTSVAWDQSNSYKNDPNAFLFSLVNPQYAPTKLAIKNSSQAIYCHRDFGPTFGSAHDLCISPDNNYSRLGTTYKQRYVNNIYLKTLSEAENFSVFDIESFQVL